MHPENTKGTLVLSVSIAAIIGALSGVAAFYFLSSGGLPNAAFEALSDDQMESHLVELIEDESATIAVVERVTPAVVSVVVKKTQNALSRSQTQRPFFFNQFNGEAPNEDGTSLVEISGGTAFFVTEDGYLLTNRHVVDEKDASFFIVMSDGKELEATIIDIDPFQDIAVLKVEGEDFPVVNLGSDVDAIIGQTVIAIGNSLSEVRNTVTKGVVSGINRRVTTGGSLSTDVIEEAIQTDAAINSGNSGGPLINLLGEVIGINTAVSFQGENIGFAIPIKEAKRAITDVLEFGRIIRPWLGVRYVLVEPRAVEDHDLEYEVGALIVAGSQPGQIAVFVDSPADKAGIQEDDVVIAVNDVYLTREKALAETVSEYRPGDTISITYLRNGKVLTAEVTLAEYDLDEL